MSEVYLTIAAPWQYRPSEGVARSLVSVLPRCGLVRGAPVEETEQKPDGRRGMRRAWAAGPAVGVELGWPHCERVTLSVTEWLQPMVGLGEITCPNGHKLPDSHMGSYLDALYETGQPPRYHCDVCGANGSLLSLDTKNPHYTLMASRLWLRLDNVSEPFDADGPAVAAVKRVLGVDKLEFGVFNIAW